MSTTYIRYFEDDEGDGETVICRCKHCGKEILPSQARAEVSDPENPGKTIFLHDDAKPLDCKTKWYDARRNKVSVGPLSGLHSRT